MSTKAIENMRKHLKPASPYVRPYGMEALIRNGEAKETVFAELAATGEERAKVERLLAGPSVWGGK